MYFWGNNITKILCRTMLPRPRVVGNVAELSGVLQGGASAFRETKEKKKSNKYKARRPALMGNDGVFASDGY